MKQVISMDIGGTNMRIALVDELYRINKVMRFPTIVGDKTAFLNQVASIIGALQVNMDDVSAISIGVPGRVDDEGFITTLPNIKIKEIPLASFLKKKYQKPVFVKNDAAVAALAEANLGVGKHFKRTYFITISTGIGGALVVNHQLQYSNDEIGHTLFPYKNGYYELEQIASGTGIINLCALNNLPVQASSLFFSLVNSGNIQAQAIFNDWLDLMSAFLNLVQHQFEPDIIAIAGGVMKSKDIFLEKLTTRVKGGNLRPAEFGDDAGLMGATSLAFQFLSVNNKTPQGVTS